MQNFQGTFDQRSAAVESGPVLTDLTDFFLSGPAPKGAPRYAN